MAFLAEDPEVINIRISNCSLKKHPTPNANNVSTKKEDFNLKEPT